VRVVTYRRVEYKNPGMGGIFPALLPEGRSIVPYLVRIFRTCLATGYVPARWRQVNVVVGTSHKSTIGPFQGSQQHLHWPYSGPFQGTADNPHEELSGPFQDPNQTATHRYQRPFSGSRPNRYAKRSAALFRAPRDRVSLFRPIRGQSIPTNHKSVYSDLLQASLF
jgi:hypothetical protein